MAGVKIDVKVGDGIRGGVQLGDTRLGITIGGNPRGVPASPNNPNNPGNSQATGNPAPGRQGGPPAARPNGLDNGQGNGNAFGHTIGRGNPNRPDGVNFDSPRDFSARPGDFGRGNIDGRGNSFEMGPVRFPGRAEYPVSEGARTEAMSLGNYFRGTLDSSALLPGTRDLMSHISNITGEPAMRNFVERSGQPGVEVLGRYIQQSTQVSNPGRDSMERNEVQRNLQNDLLYTVQLERHFSRLDQLAGSVSQRAREESLSVLARFGGDSCSCSSVSVSDMLRDLRNGALLQERDVNSPFPLTGSVRVSRELAALMRTIEAIEIALSNGLPGKYSDYCLSALMAWLGIDAETARLLLASLPALPGRAGRMEIMAYCAALGGLLADSKGKPLLALDGTPLKLGELLWFSPLGGLFDSSAPDRGGPRASPISVYGFDALFTLVAFDGKSLALPMFIAIQAQTNGSEPESLYGQVPYSEGWMRALIEKLKDSASFDHNQLGEQLEEALTDDRFRLAILRGAVDSGEPVPGSFDLSMAPATAAAFA